MKKFFNIMVAVICSLGIAIGLSACKSNNKISYNKVYSFKSASFMGFSGDRTSIQKYIESQDSAEEINEFINYFDLVMRIKITFNKDGVGTLSIPGLITSFGSSTPENVQNMIDAAKKAGTINSSGDFVVSFDYEKNNNEITIKTIHTKVQDLGNNGDLSFANALELLASKTDTSNKLTNQDANVLKIEKNSIVLKLSFEHKANEDSSTPDVASDLFVSFGK